MVEVQKCSWLEFSAYREFPALLAEYAEECAMEGMPPPELHEPLYMAMERSGSMDVLCATVEGRLVGFLVLLVSPNPHYGGAKIGVVESFFVARNKRKTGAGDALQRFANASATQRGAVAILVIAPLGSKLALVLERDKAYRESNRVFFRRLN
jgi:GNAT superfamily N-acetyltransferase